MSDNLSAEDIHQMDLDPWGVSRGEPSNYAATREPAFIDGYVSGLAHGIDLGWGIALDIDIRCGTAQERAAYSAGQAEGLRRGRAALLAELLAADDIEFIGGSRG